MRLHGVNRCSLGIRTGFRIGDPLGKGLKVVLKSFQLCTKDLQTSCMFVESLGDGCFTVCDAAVKPLVLFVEVIGFGMEVLDMLCKLFLKGFKSGHNAGLRLCSVAG